MEIVKLKPKEFANIFSNPFIEFGSVNFNVLNKSKVDDILFLGFREKKFRLGIIFGVENLMLKSPFSAPFGGFVFTKNAIKIETIHESILVLESFVKSEGYLKMMIPSDKSAPLSI